MKTKSLIALLFAVTIFTLNACKDDKEEVQGTSPMMVRMTDSPGDYEEVNINIQEVWVHADNGNGWTELTVNKGMYNLLDFTAGIDTLIASGDIPSGRVSQIRLVLGDGNTVKVNGVLFPLSTPSAEQSGLKLQIHADLVRDVTYTVLIDFDACKSIVQTGAGTYKLKPVLRTIINAQNGGIRGMVIPATASVAIMAVHNTDTFGTYTNSSGEFLIKGLASGSYDVIFDTHIPYKDTTVHSVSVTAGSVTNIGIVSIEP